MVQRTAEGRGPQRFAAWWVAVLSLWIGELSTALGGAAPQDRIAARHSPEQQLVCVQADSVMGSVTQRDPPLSVRNLRLGRMPPIDTLPASLLVFDLCNEGQRPLTDVVVRVVIADRRGLAKGSRPLVGPLTIRGKVVLRQGYALNYGLLFRNLSSECACEAEVKVVSARSLPD